MSDAGFVRIRDAIAARLRTVAGLEDRDDGTHRLHARERFSARESVLRGLYADGDAGLRGGYVRRIAGGETLLTESTVDVVDRWRIVVLQSFVDSNDPATASEPAFDAMLESIRAAFRVRTPIAGARVHATDGGRGLSVDDVSPSMFGGVLVHFAQLTLATVRVEVLAP